MTMHPSLRSTDHRPWPLPKAAWTWTQSWLDLAFLHYRVEATAIGRLLPAGVTVQEFDGSAWVAVVPFRMAKVSRRPFTAWASLPSFPELNLRTYVEVDGKPGVWFFSLDADCWPVVWGGRNLYHLPYHAARMQQTVDGDGFAFTSLRRQGGVRFAGRYRPVGEGFLAKAGTFEHWATERYCLYSPAPPAGIARVDVHHAQWPLQRAEVQIEQSDVLTALGITPLDPNPICHFSVGVDVVSYPATRVNKA